ncbi:MAG: polymer-forming cytoskeletal protein [Candidatus Bathycorpusculaceae bacterium]
MSGEEKMKEYEKKLRETAIPTTCVSGSGKVRLEGIGDIRISGSGIVSPEEIKLSGSGSLPGGLKVRRVSSAGSVSIEGDIEAEEMSFSGSSSIAGNVSAKTLSASGSLSIGGEVKGSLFKAAGSCKVGKGVNLEDTLQVHGSFKALNDVKAKNLVELHGVFTIHGKIVTNRFEVELSRHESHVKNGIEAVNVSVKSKGAEGLIIFGIPIVGKIFHDGKLYTTNIIAKEMVYLENVCCENVYGRDVTIGKGCVINGKVKYSSSVSIHSEAKLANRPEKAN